MVVSYCLVLAFPLPNFLRSEEDNPQIGNLRLLANQAIIERPFSRGETAVLDQNQVSGWQLTFTLYCYAEVFRSIPFS